MPEHLEHHTNMKAIHAANLEVVEQLDRLVALRVVLVRVAHVFQQLDLVQCSLGEVRCRFYHFESHKSFVLQISSLSLNYLINNRQEKKKRQWDVYII